METVGGSIRDGVLSGTDFVAAWATHERNAARLAVAARRFEQSGEWAHDGSVSMASWLRHHCRMSNRDANTLIHRGRFLDTFTSVGEAASSGLLSAGQVTALQVSCRGPVEPILAVQQAEVVAIVAPLSVGDTERAAQLWRQRADALVELPEPVEPDRRLRVAHTADGIVGTFALDNAGATQFTNAIRIASTWDGSDDTRSNPRRSADALVDVCAFFNANHDRPGTPRKRPHIELTVEADTLSSAPVAWTNDHAHLSTATTDALLCDCVIHRVVRAGNAVLAYGRATHTVPTNLFRAVAIRDGGCRHPGCERNIAWCDAHHIHHWRHLGLTEYENLVLLCNRHHHHVHRHNLNLKLLPNGDLEITQPDGTTHTSQPRGQPAKGP
ncbi:MAG: hypothetical protein QOE09_1236 [Ilumatobacteraceae bacterium]|jgi:hypothetical protein